MVLNNTNLLSLSYLFAFSYCSWGSQVKSTEVVCHSLLQWTTFCQNCLPWPICLGWPYMAWLIVSLKSYDKPRKHIKTQRHYFANKGLSSQSYGFSSSDVWMWELDHNEGWAPKNWCFWTEVLDKTLESPLDCKEIQPVYPKGNQSWIFIGRTDAEAEAPIVWLPYANIWFTGKDLDAGKDWRQEEKGTTEDEMVGCHHWLGRHEFEQAPGIDDGQGRLVCCSPWGCRVGHEWATEVNWT